jgi:methionyl-tRNA synthetase
VIGKDITRFHCVIWPAMLMSAGLPLPRQVFGHGWVHLKGEKMSKSLGTIVDPLEAAQRFGPDPLRLYLVKEIPYGSDGDFSWERFEDRYNVDLANNLGNLVSRVAAMAEKYHAGSLAPGDGSDGRLPGVAAEALAGYRRDMDRYALEGGAAAAFRVVDAANEYIAATEPWVLARDARQAGRLSQVLYDVAEAVRVAAVLLLPVIPRSAAEILRRVGVHTPLDELRLEHAAWRGTGERRILKGDALWPRLVVAEPGSYAVRGESADMSQAPPPGSAKQKRSQHVEQQSTGDAPAAPAQPVEPARADGPQTAPPAGAADASTITIDDFMKVDLRVAKVLSAEKVPASRKLVRMTVDVGSEQRTLVAGIAEAYEAEQLVGRTVVVVFNLKPARLMGIESKGMVLAASPDGGRPALVGLDQDVPPGTRVR